MVKKSDTDGTTLTPREKFLVSEALMYFEANAPESSDRTEVTGLIDEHFADYRAAKQHAEKVFQEYLAENGLTENDISLAKAMRGNSADKVSLSQQDSR